MIRLLKNNNSNQLIKKRNQFRFLKFNNYINEQKKVLSFLLSHKSNQNQVLTQIPKIFFIKKSWKALQLQGFPASILEQGMRESNSRQRFWRPLSYHLTNPLYTRKSGCWPRILLHCTLKTTYMLVDC